MVAVNHIDFGKEGNNVNVEQTALIRQVDREAFARDGAVVIRQLLDPQWLDLLAEVAEEIRHAVKTGEGDGGPRPSVEMDQKGDYVYCENGWMFNDKLRRFAEASDVACAAAEVMGSKEARLFETLSIYKEQGCDVPTAWHQDLPQHGIEGDQVCSVWLSLEAVDEPSGALRFVPGSHLGPWFTPGTMPPGREGDRVPLPAGPCPDPDLDRARYPEIISYDTQPGDVVLVHPNILHGTLGNPQGTRRRSFSIRFFGDDVCRKATRWEWHSWLKELPLRDGDPMRGDMFPRLWPH